MKKKCLKNLKKMLEFVKRTRLHILIIVQASRTLGVDLIDVELCTQAPLKGL